VKQTVTVTRSRRKGEKLTQKHKEKIIELAQNTELSQGQIAKLTDVEKSTVCKVLQNYGMEHRSIEEYKSNRASILAGLQQRIAKSVTDEDLKKASLQVKAMAYGVFYDKERLELGKSTSITDDIDSILHRIESRYTKAIDITPSNDNK
jgi:hypothetical protein